MGEAVKTEKAPKKSWYKGLKAEFKKVIWPDQKTLVKQTIAVVSVSILLCGVISILDAIITFGVNILVR